MSSPAELKTCSRCGAALTPGALQGLCPRCLLALNLGTQTEMTAEDAKPQPAPEPPALAELATHFPDLEILELLGRGGMGAVYKARQKQLDRIVALKILPPRPGDDSAFAERFTREAKALAKLLHPNIVALFEFGQADGIYYLLMEYVDGVSLGQLLRSSRVAPREALAIVPQICDALQYAHDQGIVHRDIKPENILMDRRGRVKVADFGLAKLVEPPAADRSAGLRPGADGPDPDAPGRRPALQLTEAGKIMGTPKYMSPEQIEAPGEVDHRADIYALGVVFYQMLTGELPGKPLHPPSSKVQMDVRLDEVVLRALAQKPELRYQQASILKTEVETIAATPAGATSAKSRFVKGVTPQEAEELGRDFRRLFGRQGLIALAQQCLLLFDLSAPVPPFVERAGRRRLNFWPFLLLFCSTIGFGVNSLIFAFSLAWRFYPGTPPQSGGFALTAQECNLLIWATLGAVGRLAALNLGQASKEITRRRVLGACCWTLLYAAMIPCQLLLTAVLSPRLDAASPAQIMSIAQLAKRLGIVVLLVVGLSVILQIIRSTRISRRFLHDEPPSPTQSWCHWWGFQSPEAGQVCSHLTKEERRHLSVLQLLYGVWGIATAFGLPALTRTMRSPDKWVVTTLWVALFLVSLPMIYRMMRHFLGSTQWARQQGLTPARLPLFSFRVSNVAKALAFLGGMLLVVYAADRAITTYLGESEPARPVSSALFIARLPQGTVELVAVSRHPSAHEPWWRPDGSPAREGPFEVNGVSVKADGGIAREFVIRLEGLPQDADGPMWEFDPAGGRHTGGRPALAGRAVADMLQAAAQFPRAARTATLKLRFGWGKWDPVVSVRPGLTGITRTDVSKGYGWQISFMQPTERDGSAAVTVADSVKEWETRVIAVDKNGQDHPGTEDQRSGSAFEQYTTTFDRLPLGQIKEFWFQVRPYRRVEFRNVSLQPGLRTQVEIGDAAQEPLKAIGTQLEAMLEPAGRPAGSRTHLPTLQFRWVAAEGDTNSPADSLPYLQARREAQTLRVLREVVADSDDVESAGFTEYQPGGKELAVFLTPEGARKLAEATAKNVGRQLAIVWEDRVVSAPVMRAPITGRGFNITGLFTDAEAKQLLDLLNHRPPGVIPSPNASTPPAQAATPEQLAQPPKLRFIAWQDEWKTNQPGAARHPDGSPVTDTTELNWLRQVHPATADVRNLELRPEPRFLHLWFSHPAFDPNGLHDVSLLDEAGQRIPLGGSGSVSSGVQGPRDGNGNLGWFTAALSPGASNNPPSRLTVRLRYTVGPLEHVQAVAVTPNTQLMTGLQGGSQLNGVGQNVDGRAFVAIAVDRNLMPSRQFGVVAIAKEGHEIPGAGGASSTRDGSPVEVQRFDFQSPLTEVARFRIGTRPIRTNEWRNVVLPP